MKQSKIMSMVESVANIAVGLAVAMIANAIILPLVGFDVSFKQNAVIAAFMTVVSIVRSFALRRIFEALHIRRPISPFMQAVIAERYRQIEQEGWSADHDDKNHKQGELARAGAAYALYAPRHVAKRKSGGMFAFALSAWPWAKSWWKPTDFRRDLVKAAALIVAEGDLCDRLKKKRAA